MKATEYFGGNYLKASDITQQIEFTIKNVTEEKLEGKPKLVINFHETDKGLVLNKINTTRTITWMGTEETDEWNGKRLTLYSTTVEYDGKDVPCIRVKKKEEA